MGPPPKFGKIAKAYVNSGAAGVRAWRMGKVHDVDIRRDGGDAMSVVISFTARVKATASSAAREAHDCRVFQFARTAAPRNRPVGSLRRAAELDALVTGEANAPVRRKWRCVRVFGPHSGRNATDEDFGIGGRFDTDAFTCGRDVGQAAASTEVPQRSAQGTREVRSAAMSLAARADEIGAHLLNTARTMIRVSDFGPTAGSSAANVGSGAHNSGSAGATARGGAAAATTTAGSTEVRTAPATPKPRTCAHPIRCCRPPASPWQEEDNHPRNALLRSLGIHVPAEPRPGLVPRSEAAASATGSASASASSARPVSEASGAPAAVPAGSARGGAGGAPPGVTFRRQRRARLDAFEALLAGGGRDGDSAGASRTADALLQSELSTAIELLSSISSLASASRHWEQDSGFGDRAEAASTVIHSPPMFRPVSFVPEARS